MSTDEPSRFPQPQDQPPQAQQPQQQSPQQPWPGAAAPQFGQPAVPPSPQFGAYPQQPGGYQQPYGGYPPQYAFGAAPMARPARPLNKVLPILELVFAVAYILVGVGMILALNHRNTLANQMMAQFSDTSDPSVNLTAAASADNLINTLSWIAIVVFLGALIVFGAWRQSLRASLAPSGQFGPVLRQSGYTVFRIVWLASILLSLFATNTSAPDELSSLVSLDNRLMLYYGLRAAVGVVLLVLTLRLMQISQKVYQQQYFGPNTPVGF